jgi:hypothetical protein
MKISLLGFHLIANDVSPNAPLLYRIWIKESSSSEVKTIYVGKSKLGANRPFTNYDDNIRRMTDGRKSRSGKGFRKVHHEMHAAHLAGKTIGIELVRNIDSSENILLAEKMLSLKYGL